MTEIQELAPRLPTKYLRNFFAEATIPEVEWTLKDNTGTDHFISNVVVVEHMVGMSKHEAKQMEDALRKLDFHNADINHFLRHLAGAIINR